MLIPSPILFHGKHLGNLVRKSVPRRTGRWLSRLSPCRIKGRRPSEMTPWGANFLTPFCWRLDKRKASQVAVLTECRLERAPLSLALRHYGLTALVSINIKIRVVGPPKGIPPSDSIALASSRKALLTWRVIGQVYHLGHAGGGATRTRSQSASLA